ncbi:MAG: hypothetical protein JSR45_02760 [Proteobacteria bacterium]|nr:hypothetical protein [Pseudomonadota bacterium]
MNAAADSVDDGRAPEEAARDEARPARISEPALRDAAWFLHAIDLAGRQARFTRTNRQALSAQSFLDPRWSRAGAAETALPLDALADAPEPPRSPGIIWHSAFCCSTLIAACLDKPGKALALKEPMALVNLAQPPPGVAAAHPRLVRGAVRLLGRAFEGRERVVIKPSNAANDLIEAMAPAAGPMLFLHSNLRWFLLSVVRGGEQRRAWVRPLLIRRLGADELRRLGLDLALLTDLGAAALLWRLQMAEFEAAVARYGPERTRLLDCETFLAAPERTLSELDAFFELGLGEAHVLETVRGPAFFRHAKNPRAAFDLTRHRRDLALAEQSLGQDLGLIIDWSARVMAALSGHA